jgi:predicted HAD superfamily Cof-like phosphohydrolase
MNAEQLTHDGHDELKICMRCKLIIDLIFKYKIDSMGIDVDSIFEILHNNVKEAFGIKADYII